MIKMGPKSTRAAATTGAILYCENDSNVLAAQAKVFEKAGYTVERTIGRKAAEQAFLKNRYDAVVLGHTLTKDERHHLPYMAKKAGANTQVLVLHASGKHPAVDYALDSREGDQAVIEALAELLTKNMLVAV